MQYLVPAVKVTMVFSWGVAVVQVADGTVLQEFRKGFKMGDKLIRPAMVKVRYHMPARPRMWRFVPSHRLWNDRMLVGWFCLIAGVSK
jgi:hypothetical protein